MAIREVKNMRYPDDLNTEDVIDIFISKGLLTDADIENFVINEHEAHIQRADLENQKIEAERKEESIRLAKQTEARKSEKEKELKEIRPFANNILSQSRKYELIARTSWIWWVCGMSLGAIFHMGSWSWIYYGLFMIQAGYGISKRPRESKVTLAKEALATA